MQTGGILEGPRRLMNNAREDLRFGPPEWVDVFEALGSRLSQKLENCFGPRRGGQVQKSLLLGLSRPMSF